MSWILSLVIGITGTAFGAFAGAWSITKLQDSKNKEPRKLLLRAIRIFEGYDTYQDAENEFNKLSLVEKKAILVALKNLGIPVHLKLINDRFNIESVLFDDAEIKENELSSMCSYVRDGLCDKLFFNEIGSNFYQVPPKIVMARGFAIKILNAMRSHDLSITAEKLAKVAGVSFNQFEVVYVFWKTLNVSMETCNKEGKYDCDGVKIDKAVQDVTDGIFDHLYYWDHRAFENMNSQRIMADNLNAGMFAKVN